MPFPRQQQQQQQLLRSYVQRLIRCTMLCLTLHSFHPKSGVPICNPSMMYDQSVPPDCLARRRTT